MVKSGQRNGQEKLFTVKFYKRFHRYLTNMQSSSINVDSFPGRSSCMNISVKVFSQFDFVIFSFNNFSVQGSILC